MAETSLAGKVAIVTGAGRGLGRAMALGLARAGASVIALAARERREIEELAAQDSRVLPHLADVARDDDCRAAAEAALARFGRLDILVNNAGRGMKYVSDSFMTEPTRFWEVEPDTWRMVIDTNVNGPFLMARAAVPAMRKAGWGRIVNISMGRGTMRRKGFSPYGPSKAALESETIIWAQDLAGSGITVNALLPGGASATGMIPDSFPASLRTSLLDPEIMVAPLLYLCSDTASGVTGMRFVARAWRADLPAGDAAAGALENAGWPGA